MPATPQLPHLACPEDAWCLLRRPSPPGRRCCRGALPVLRLGGRGLHAEEGKGAGTSSWLRAGARGANPIAVRGSSPAPHAPHSPLCSYRNTSPKPAGRCRPATKGLLTAARGQTSCKTISASWPCPPPPPPNCRRRRSRRTSKRAARRGLATPRGEWSPRRPRAGPSFPPLIFVMRAGYYWGNRGSAPSSLGGIGPGGFTKM